MRGSSQEQLRDYLTGEVYRDPAIYGSPFRKNNRKKDNLFLDSINNGFYILRISSTVHLNPTF